MRRVSGISFADDDWVDVAEYYDPYLRPLRKFDVNAINSRIIKSLTTWTDTSEGPLKAE
eukprot:CAMPEP_0178911102 /NCGR_PEP_ID=MMETSP0786-20121207/9491_1 /TAXON_ID=186022 /ORGANISM="Thalassionema frauenfeldii, Strain CCMP 1798" /LENGTH=58 /DNA_ID=CAMNT_0020583477 /DNA_START=91 /DNA_END=264 /DNA_ORIENTATION=-